MINKKTTTLTVLLILFSGASVAYLVKSQKEISTLKQRVVELTQELAQAQTQHSRPQPKQSAHQSSGVVNTPLKATADTETSVSDDDGNPLKQAVLTGDVKALRALIESDADLSGLYADGQSLLHLAAWSDDAEVVTLLIKSGLGVSVVDDKGRTPLHFAAGYGHLMTAQQLIELGADLETVDSKGTTPLMTAVRHGNNSMVDALIGAGANITVTTASHDMSLLHTAAYQGNAKTLTVLLNGGIDSNALDGRGRTALHYAKADMVPLLVGAGMDVNQTD